MKRETWLALLSNGEVEVLPGPALEDAFRSGLVDARTRVRAVSSPIWETVGEVARLSTPPSVLTSSLAPIELEEAASPREWAGGSRRGRAVGILVGAVTMFVLAGVVGLGTWAHRSSAELTLGARSTAVAPAALSEAHHVRHVPAPSVEPLHRDTNERVRDGGERKHERSRGAVRPSKAAFGNYGSTGRLRNTAAAKAAVVEPAGWEGLRNTNRFDPLDGAL